MSPLERYIAEESAAEYKAGRITHRELIRRLTMLTGSAIAALTLAVSMGCSNNELTSPTNTSVPAATATSAIIPTTSPTQIPTAAPTQTPVPATLPAGVTVSPNDPAIEASSVSFTVADVKLMGYLARPKTAGPHPAVLVIHENRGLLPHFEDVARRFAKEGYVALSLDLLSREGGTASVSNASSALSSAGNTRHVQDLNSAITYMAGLPYVDANRIGTTGFCFGGGLVWLLTVRNPSVKAGVPFYGSAPPASEVPNMQAAVLGIYGALDSRINSTRPDLEAALKQNNKTYNMIAYEGANHAFFNDTGGSYNSVAAQSAWTEMLAWFGKYLKG